MLADDQALAIEINNSCVKIYDIQTRDLPTSLKSPDREQDSVVGFSPNNRLLTLEVM